MEKVWEDFVCLNSLSDIPTEKLGPVSQYLSQDDGTVGWDNALCDLGLAISRDVDPLPRTEDREGYYGDNHFNYWASGLRDVLDMEQWLIKNGVEIGSFLDFGCASGRIIRHVHHQMPHVSVLGCDINRRHVDWVANFLPSRIGVFQSTSMPFLPIPDASIDLVSAYSVFTHIESFETAWLMEMRRILRPGGIAWITIHGDRVWRQINPDWPLYGALHAHPKYAKYREYKNLPEDRLVFRWHADRSYSSNVFYSYEYIKRVWGRFFSLVEIRVALPHFQDVVVLRKV